MIIPDKTYFLEAAKAVIDNFEGGYFHPKMYIANPKKFKVFSNSGETMFGLDRHAGFNLYYKGNRKTANVQDNLKYIESGAYEYKNEPARKFWSLLDSLNAKNTFKHLDTGGSNRDKLTILASEIMYPEFLRLAYKNLSEAAQKIVFSDPRLLFHFIYATWNGEGFFKFYAKKLNTSIQEAKNVNTLVDEQLELRKNSRYSQIRNTGEKMKQLFKNANFVSTVKNVSKNPFTWIIILGIAGLGFYLYNQKQINATI
jgi:hypothetical protein